MACCSSVSRSGEMRNGVDHKEGRGKSAPVIRCAIYTRKSTEEGLDQEFNSLHAQRESAEAYITSQKEAGWKLVPTATMTAASAAEIWSVLPCGGSSTTSKRAVWIASSSIR